MVAIDYLNKLVGEPVYIGQPCSTVIPSSSKITSQTPPIFDGQKLINEDEAVLLMIPDVLLDNNSSNQEKKAALQRQELLFQLNKNLKKLKNEYDIIFKHAMPIEHQLKQMKCEKILIEQKIETLQNELFEIENEILEVEKMINEKDSKRKFLLG